MGNQNKKCNMKCEPFPKCVRTIEIQKNMNELSPRTYFVLNKKLPENLDPVGYLMNNLIGLDDHLYDIKEQIYDLERRLNHTEHKVHILQKFIH